MELLCAGWESGGVSPGATRPGAHLPSVAIVGKSGIRYNQLPQVMDMILRTDERTRISRTSHSLKIWSSMSDGR